MSAITQKDGPVAVTGVSGFTGGHMVRELSLQGYHVRACLRDSESWRGQDAINYLKTLPNVEILDGCDLFEPGSYHQAFAGCSSVFHIATVSSNSLRTQPKGTGDVSTDVYDGLVKGTQNVVDAINASETVKRLLYTSSTSAMFNARMADPKYHWTETDWAYDGVLEEYWNSPAASYNRGKVDTENLIYKAGSDSQGQWDAVSFLSGMICGRVLFKAQLGQWNEQIGRIAAGLEVNWPTPNNVYYDMIDVRDLVKAHRLAAESSVDHNNSHGGPRYLLHGCGERSTMSLREDIPEIIERYFPGYKMGTAGNSGQRDDGNPLLYNENHSSDKAKTLLCATIRPVEETIRDLVESQIELGLIKPVLK